MMGNTRFAIWLHRHGGSMFGKTSKPVNRDGVTLSFGEEGDIALKERSDSASMDVSRSESGEGIDYRRSQHQDARLGAQR